MIANKYEVLSKIGEGKFGQVFEGRYKITRRINLPNTRDNPVEATNSIYPQVAPPIYQKVAIKIERANTPINILKHESAILNYLYENGSRNIPIVYWYGLYKTLPTLIMPFYEISLQDYMNSMQFTTKLVNQCVLRMIDILDTIHSHYVIHRDIKPQNFMFKSRQSVIDVDSFVLIDFGLATIYVDEFKDHIPYKTNKTTIIGSPKFVSINVHDGIDPSRRDDLISVGYIWAFLCNGGHLPWETIADDLTASSNHPENHILYYKNVERRRLKTVTNLTVEPLAQYMSLVHSLGFQDKPNYDCLKQILDNDPQNM